MPLIQTFVGFSSPSRWPSPLPMAWAEPGGHPRHPARRRAPHAIRRLARLPTQGLQAVETTDGQLLDGLRQRPLPDLRGTAYHLGHGAQLTSLTPSRRQPGRAHRSQTAETRPRLIWAALDTGTGPAVLAFVDPQCPHCADLAGRSAVAHRPVPVPADPAAHRRGVADRGPGVALPGGHRPGGSAQGPVRAYRPTAGDARWLRPRDRPACPGHRAIARRARHPLADRARRAPPPGPTGGPGRLVGGGGDRRDR